MSVDLDQSLAELVLERPSSARVLARWGLDYWQQLADGRVVMGGFRDVGGDAEWTFDPTPSDAVQDALTARLRSIGVTAPITHRWGAIVGYTEIGVPVFEAVAPNVLAMGGYSGTGNVVGALCGRAAAELITTGTSPFAALLRD